MKLWNWVRALSLCSMLALVPAVSEAKLDYENNISKIIENEIWKAHTISLIPPVFVYWNCAETQEWKPVQVMYYRTTKTWEKVWLILVWIQYKKKEMWWFQKTIVWWVSWPFEVYIAPEWTELIPTAHFHVVKIKK